MLQSRWRGILHHVTNKHEWIIGDGGGPAACEHNELPQDREKPWLEPGSPTHKKLQEIVLEPKLLKEVDRYVNFRQVEFNRTSGKLS